MFEALLLDFYGTIVHEDDTVIDQICATISESAATKTPVSEINQYWWTVFSDAFEQSYGPNFQAQRVLEIDSLAQTIGYFGAECDAQELSTSLFQHWSNPPIFEDSVKFLALVDVPVIVLSNIDRQDIEAAIDRHQLTFDHLLTSEDVRSYKPRPELFNAGLGVAAGPHDRVLHVGDSLTSDVAGATRVGIPTAWINRQGKPSPTMTAPTYEASDLESLLSTLGT